MESLETAPASLSTGMSVLLSEFRLFPFQDMGGDFLLNPVSLRFFTASLHMILFIIILILWVNGRFRSNSVEKEKPNASHLYYKLTLLSCLAMSLFNLALCILNMFCWKRSGWSDENIATSLDLGVKIVAWSTLFLFMRIQSSNETKYPLVLRLWFGLFFTSSCYCVIINFFCNKKQQNVSSLFWISDIVSSLMGLIFSYLGWGKKYDEDDEPLLNCSIESSKPLRGDEIVTPYSRAGIWGLLSFSWIGDLVSLGNNKILDLEDVPQLNDSDSVRGAFPTLNRKLESYGDGSNGKVMSTFMLAKGLIFTVWKEIVISAFYALVYTIASYVGPLLIDSFVNYLDGRRNFQNEGYMLVSVFFIAKVFECLAQRHWYFKVQQAGYRARAALVAKVYTKGLTLSSQSKKGHTTGEIINFMSVDADRIGDFGWYMHDPWLVVVQVALALVILYRNLGLASVAALVATVLVMLANGPLGALEEKFQDKLMQCKDERMKATSEVLRNMKILKLQAWELKFLSKILDLRKMETGWLKRYFVASVVSTFVFWGAPTFVSVVTFGTCMLIGIPLESGKVLSALATFRILQEPIYNLPDAISMIVQTKVSLDRIASFLSLEDLEPGIVEKIPIGSSDIAVEITDGNFTWDTNPTLIDINLRVSHGMRVAICGTVGSGKSSLLSSILGEMPKISGVIKVSGAKAYVAQTSWILSGKIEDNILFGKKMERERYDSVLEACCLKKDLEILSFGDQTIVGERGINLSGGQKQRVQIARALYQDADIYLFDDPFSAVDAHTGTHLFNECILGHLESKTVIYITHQVEFLPAADVILVMKDGRIKQAGKYNDILNSGTDFMELVGAYEEALSALARDAGTSEESSNSNRKPVLGKQESQVDNYEEIKKQIVQEEEREKGNVGLSVYWKYITAAYGGFLVPFILLAQILFQTLQIGSNYWIAWATPVSKDLVPPVESSTLLIVYVALAIGSSFCIFSRAFLVAIAGFKTATILFEKMHSSLFLAPMYFFDSTPSARILNRASTDQSTVDLELASLVGLFAFAIIQLLGIIFVMSQVAWQVFIIFIPVVAICIWLQQYYIGCARELARLTSVCIAPVIQHFSETLSGASTIRSFDQEARFRDISMGLIDGHSRPKFHGAAAMEWLCIRLDMLSLITFAFSLVFLISIPEGTIDPSVAGLAVTYGLNLNMLQALVVWHLCTMEQKIIAVERILQYTSIPSEAPLIVESNRPQSHWPVEGEVKIQDLQVRYGPHMPFVLRGLTCTFFGGKKSGIVGRTGSGKSTLIQTLFRVVEPTSGQILIDGIDILSIGLHDLRTRLSIIPQDPTMFEGTVRTNLDPLEHHTDAQIWEALDKCQLGEEVRKKEGKLDSSVSENGENWSVGQRQLVCLGRVLLKKSKILVLDEATASVDTTTDNLIQQTLKHHFADSTVITIAHRITSVLDSDIVVLLDHGLVAEYDTPKKLLADKTSSFTKLVSEYSMRSSSGL